MTVVGQNIFGEAQLLILDFSLNELSVIRPTTIKQLQRVMDVGFLRVSSNKFICNCNQTLLHTVSGLQQLKHKIVNYEHLTCLENSEGELFVARVDVDIIYDQCFPNHLPHFITAGVTCLLTTVTLITCYCLRRKRYVIKTLFYKFKSRKFLASSRFEFDCYASHCSTELFWIHDCLCKKLEDEFNFKLCIAQRDFGLGVAETDEIFHHMNKSRTVLIVLSENFARSATCRYDLTQAFELLRRDGKQMIVIKMGELSPEIAAMDPKIAEILMSKGYIVYPLNNAERSGRQYTLNKTKQDAFWSKVRSKIYETMSKSDRHERRMESVATDSIPMLETNPEVGQGFHMLNDECIYNY